MNESTKKELKSNTFLFGVGEICTKVLQYIVALFLSYFLSTEETGDITLIKTSALLIIPLVSIDIIEAVFRFSADKTANKKAVFSSGVIVSLGAGVLLVPATIVLHLLFAVSSPIIVYFFIASLMVHNIVHYFVKGVGKVRLYVINSLLFAVGTCGVTLLCLFVFGGGVKTYFVCYTATCLFCIVFMIVAGQLWRFFSIRSIDRKTFFSMLRYSAPLIINTIGWWLISASDTYITNIFLGNGAVGVLSYSHKFPSLLSSFYAIFGMAFQLLAITKLDFQNDQEKAVAEESFSAVFNKLVFAMGFLVLLIITVSEPAIKFLVSSAYYESWRYVSMYTFGMFFFVLSSFYGYIYNVKKRNAPLLVSTILCGLCNIGLCYLLYWLTGSIFSAALSTLVSYFLIFIFRALDSRRILPFKIDKRCIFVFLFLLVAVLINSFGQFDSRYLFGINFFLTSGFFLIFRNDMIMIVRSILK